MANGPSTLGGKNGGDWRNVVIGILTAVIIMLGGGWLTVGSRHVSKDELASLQGTIAALQTTVGALQTSVAVLNDRLQRSGQ